MNQQVLSLGKGIGILGGGQLGMFTAMAAIRMGYGAFVFSDNPLAPAARTTPHFYVGSYQVLPALQKFVAQVAVLTYEFEHLPYDAIRAVEDRCPELLVRPSSGALRVAQNRIREKQTLEALGIKVAPYVAVESPEATSSVPEKLGYPFLLKTSQQGYDGKGQTFVEDQISWNDCVSKMTRTMAYVGEKYVDFECELSVIVARDVYGDMECFPVALNTHQQGILVTSRVPSGLPLGIEKRAVTIAKKIAHTLEVVGLLAVEFFLDKEGELLVNELAPRPHNSGHWSLDACNISQFEQQIRVICGMPVMPVSLLSACRMQNILGDIQAHWESAISRASAKLYIYGKHEARKGRKMGHINFLE